MEKHITIGIAGHVDHGKTSLVKAMTGIDTDRLQEEKRRGLSIESGIAPMELSSGQIIALVDVPGHTDFLKNTIRGFSSVDAALLLVAADDGSMAQTREHVEILSFFGARKGFVVLSKADLVNDELLELAELEVREMLEGTFLENSPVIPFSAIDNNGLDRIRTEIEAISEALPGRDTNSPFRLWIDRIKVFPGFGIVVSGSVLSGKLKENNPVQVLPGNMETRARSLESHHHKVSMISAGQRAGVNLHKVSIREVSRGMLLAEPGSIFPSYLLNVHIRALAANKTPIKDKQRVKLYLGTSITNAMVVLLEREIFESGQQALAQFRLMRPVAAQPGDHFVISLLNVPVIIGGGNVLEITEEKYRQAKAARMIPYLDALRSGDIKGFLGHLLEVERNTIINAKGLMQTTGISEMDIRAELKTKIRNKELLSFGSDGVFPKGRFQELKGKALETFTGIFSANPLKPAVTPEEIKQKIALNLDDSPFRKMIAELCNEGKLIKLEGGFRVSEAAGKLTEERERLISLLMDYVKVTGFVPFSADTFWKLHHKKHDKKEIQRLLDYLHVQRRLICLNNRRFMLPEAMEKIKVRIKVLIEKKGSLCIGDCKEVLGYGRTVGVPVFEYLDTIGFTRRDGCRRVLK